MTRTLRFVNLFFLFFLRSLKEGSSEKDDVVKDDIKQLPDLKRDPKKGLLSNGVSVSECACV